ncbi:hypothetical protein CBR_g20318 [Chara braunii]|uniref:Uncharacterized protein n=1 Tax=Chara braunii TaxID=69332 RepID=A0A388L0H0_CHABU|nr:hypothetical protein CBR_g20318 [Chara braunii]|eukprot:GBG75693.1 hypothetical protein CBR_g20318 [Chara braunii]
MKETPGSSVFVVQIAEYDQRLRQLAEGGDQVSTLNKRARCSWELLQLHKGRLELVLESRSESAAESLRSMGIKEPNASPTEVLNFIEGLSGAVTEQSLAESAKIQQQQSAAKKGDAGRGRVQAQLADLRKQMADLGNAATEIAGKIRVAEEALVKLRTELSNVEARRASLQEQYRQKAASGGSGTRAAAANVAAVPCTQVAASLQKHGAQLSAVHALKNFVLRTQKSWGERVSRERQDPRQSMESAVGGYLQALAAHLRNKQQQQQEVKQRLRFCLEKMVPLETEMHQLVHLKKTSLANELVKPLQALQKIQKMRNEHNLITAAASAEISLTPIQAHLPYGCARGVASTEALSALLTGAPGIDFLSNASGLSTPTSPPTPHTTTVATQGQIVI